MPRRREVHLLTVGLVGLVSLVSLVGLIDLGIRADREDFQSMIANLRSSQVTQWEKQSGARAMLQMVRSTLRFNFFRVQQLTLSQLCLDSRLNTLCLKPSK